MPEAWMESWKSWKLNMDGEGYPGTTVTVSETWFREQSNWRTGVPGYMLKASRLP